VRSPREIGSDVRGGVVSAGFFAFSSLSAVDGFLSLLLPLSTLSCSRFLLLFLELQRSALLGGMAGPVPELSIKACSAAARCLRKASSWSAVSCLIASSFARLDSRTESRKSTSSSSRARNWFFSFAASSKASCLAASWRCRYRVRGDRPSYHSLQSRPTFVRLQDLVETSAAVLFARFDCFRFPGRFHILLSFQPAFISRGPGVRVSPSRDKARHWSLEIISVASSCR
jgi:hypothetical protein